MMENFPQFLAPKEIQLNDNNSLNARATRTTWIRARDWREAARSGGALLINIYTKKILHEKMFL